MTPISRATLERVFTDMVNKRTVTPNGPNLAPTFKKVELTADQKAFLAASETRAAQATAAYEALRKSIDPRADTAFNQAAATYTKWGKMSTDAEKAAFVQWRLDSIAEADALAEKRRQKTEES